MAYEIQEARKSQQLREAEAQQPEARLRAENYARQQELSQIGAGNWVTYICEDCEEKVRLRRNDVVRCRACGHRTLMKTRTNRIVQFEAQ